MSTDKPPTSGVRRTNSQHETTGDAEQVPTGAFRRSLRWLAAVTVAALAAWLTGIGQAGLERVSGWIGSRINSQPQVLITTNTDPQRFESFSLNLPEWVVPRPIEALEPPPGQDRVIEERDAWAQAYGGVQANIMDVQVTIRGNVEEPVILTNLRINVLERRPPISGTHVTYGPIGEGVFERIVVTDLDGRPPGIVDSYDQRGLTDPTAEIDPINFPYRVDRSEVEVFHIAAETNECDCRWNAELFYTVGGRTVSSIIDNDGEPFRLTASGNAESYYSLDGETFTPL